MNRREALRRAGWLVGGAAATPMLINWLSGCQPAPDWTPVSLTAEQHERIAVLTELIIPETDTPGARAVQVDRFVDILVTEVFPPRVRQAFLDGLDDIEARAQSEFGSAFVDLTTEQQATILQALADEDDSTREQPYEEDERLVYYSMMNFPTGPDEPAPFFTLIKEATVIGYYTSEIGATQELRYVAVPGRYDGDVPFPGDTIDRSWAI